MPWKESSVMEERLRFVARLLDGETMTDVCREFGISRKIPSCQPCCSKPCSRTPAYSDASASPARMFESTPNRRMRSPCCARRERPCCRSPAEQPNQLAAVHLIVRMGARR
jgi:hypothetical protein